MNINFKLTHPDAKAPTRAHEYDAGNDLYALEDAVVGPHHVTKIRTGVAVALPEGTVGLIKDRSSLGSKAIHVFAGVIDAGYTGEISVILATISTSNFYIKKGDKIAQLVVSPIVVVNWQETTSLSETDRGEAGFGSSGK